jgi:hypothetical protein
MALGVGASAPFSFVLTIYIKRGHSSCPMQTLPDLLNASQFDGLAITKTPAGFAVSVMSGIGEWSADVVRATAAEALMAALTPLPLPMLALPPCPVAPFQLPPCPVPLPV